MVRRGAVLKYEVRSLIFMRRYEVMNFPWDFVAIFYKMDVSTNMKYFKFEHSLILDNIS